MGRRNDDSQSGGSELRERLVNAARALVREGGMAALNLRALADREGTSTQMIYTLFGGKSGLLASLYEHWIEDLEDRMRSMRASTPDSFMRSIARTYRDHARSDPALFVAGTADPDVFRLLHDSTAFQFFTSFVRSGMEAGIFRPSEDPVRTAEAIWATIHGAVLLEIWAGDERALIDESLDAVLDGLRARPG